MSSDERLANIGLAIRKALAPVFSPKESKQELIKSHAGADKRILESCRPHDGHFDELFKIERKWARYGLPTEELQRESDWYLNPLSLSDAHVEVDGVIVGSSTNLPDAETAPSPHFLCVDLNRMHSLEDGMWYTVREPGDLSRLIEKAREQARERRLGRLADSEYF